MEKKHAANRDPITGEPGAHPVGVAGGAAGGAAAGAAVGAIGGPVGAVVGGAIGAVAGGLAGKGAAEAVNPTVEDAYWREHYKSRPYYQSGKEYDYYSPAYRYGWEAAAKPDYRGRTFEAAENDLSHGWNRFRGGAKTEWNDVRHATRDAFDRVRGQSDIGVTHASETAHDAGRYAGDKSDAVWDQVKGNWHQFKGAVKSKWNQLTDDDIDQMKGDRERIVGKIQERYGEAKWREADIANELRKSTR